MEDDQPLDQPSDQPKNQALEQQDSDPHNPVKFEDIRQNLEQAFSGRELIDIETTLGEMKGAHRTRCSELLEEIKSTSTYKDWVSSTKSNILILDQHRMPHFEDEYVWRDLTAKLGSQLRNSESSFVLFHTGDRMSLLKMDGIDDFSFQNFNRQLIKQMKERNIGFPETIHASENDHQRILLRLLDCLPEGKTVYLLAQGLSDKDGELLPAIHKLGKYQSPRNLKIKMLLLPRVPWNFEYVFQDVALVKAINNEKGGLLRMNKRLRLIEGRTECLESE